MVSAIGPEAHSNQISKPLVPWACGNEQRLTKDVTPSPRLEDLRQRPRMPGHASYSSLGHHPGNPSSHHTRVPLKVDPPFQVTIVQSKYPCVHNIKGIRGITLVGFLLDVSIKVNSEESPSLGSHLRCCTIASLSKVEKEESPSMTMTE